MDSSATALIIISLLTCAAMTAAAIVKPKIRVGRFSLSTYWIVTIAGALVILVSGLINPAYLIEGLTSDSAVNPVKILILFFAMSFLSLFLDEISFFRYLAELTVRKAGVSQIKLFIALFAVISVLTVFTSNDIIILTFTPFICYFAKYTKINPVPYLLAEFAAANTWSMALIIGNPTNIYLASMYQVGFPEYASVMILPALVTAAAAFLIIFLLFRKTLAEPLKAPDMEEHRTRISDKPALVIGLIHLGVCTALLVISSFIGVDMWLISLAAALSLVIFILVLSCIRKKGPAALASAAKRVPWEFIPFILSMFTIVLALSGAGITESLAHLLSAGDPVFTYGIASFLSANLINNIPMSVLFAFILGNVSQAALMPALYASVLGSNLCAVFTPAGALAGLMWMGILKKTEVSFSYLSFVKYGVLIALPALAAGLFILWCIV